MEGVAEWLRAWPNPLHHSLALLQHSANTLHHINFMVTDIDDIGQAMNRMKGAGVPIVFGPGRHLPSTSIFLYFLDPDGNTNEFSFGMELFEEEGARGPRQAREPFLPHSAAEEGAQVVVNDIDAGQGQRVVSQQPHQQAGEQCPVHRAGTGGLASDGAGPGR